MMSTAAGLGEDAGMLHFLVEALEHAIKAFAALGHYNGQRYHPLPVVALKIPRAAFKAEASVACLDIVFSGGRAVKAPRVNGYDYRLLGAVLVEEGDGQPAPGDHLCRSDVAG